MNFRIENNGVISKEFIKLGIADFESACQYISLLPYRRNTDKNDILCILKDKGGTCSTKHAVLRKLALENKLDGIKLILGIFKMDGTYDKRISKTLTKAGLAFIPEAHIYLKINNIYIDVTTPESNYETEIKPRLLKEQQIEYNQITDYKVHIHRGFLKKWVKTQPGLNYTVDEIWKIREQCILDLQQ
ncbi:hypothetical protein [Myroides indicus]|uniref:Uncharacterized protein n=1 Tax=Myroides indicus TaxID=1323422 RepID=A0A4R7EPJ5_9FLAO|nr:hypothetical protein [Myroides indicus]TDS53828.1 hypothetical protein C8P70_12725 [Myroides indicus]